MIYPVHVCYVGPNSKNAHGDSTEPERIGSVEIYDRPQCTNMSNRERTEGWLGTTGDTSRTAMGEYDTIEEARAAIAEDGWTEDVNIDDDDSLSYARDEDGLIEVWTKPEAEMSYVDAGDWWDGQCPDGIDADTTDEQIDDLVAEAEAEAEKFTGWGTNGVIIEGTEEYMQEHRDSLREERDSAAA